MRRSHNALDPYMSSVMINILASCIMFNDSMKNEDSIEDSFIRRHVNVLAHSLYSNELLDLIMISSGALLSILGKENEGNSKVIACSYH